MLRARPELAIKFIVELRFSEVFVCISLCVSPVMFQLSEGSLARLMSGEEIHDLLYFQILGVKNLINFSKAEDMDRYRLKISDGKTIYSFVMLFSSMNKWIHSKLLTDYSIIQVNEYTIKKVKHNGQDRVIIILLNVEVLVPGYQVNRILGNAEVSLLEEKLQFIDLGD